MIALWIGLGVIVALLVIWRLRRATKQLNLIVRQELTRPDVPEVSRAEYRNQ
jgi:hypothetical protein